MRNREAKINDALKSFEVKEFRYPVFCHQYSEYNSFHDDYKSIIKRHKEWKNKIKQDVRDQNLPADKTIKVLFEAVDKIDCNQFIEKAYVRYRIGNPPGKDNKYGDAINWECLLSAVPNDQDLYFISEDKDYRSIIFEDMFNPFLENEWKIKKNSNIYFYRDLASFLKEHTKDIALKTENDKNQLIEQLKESSSFQETHRIIASMNQYSDWTKAQIENICLAGEENTQVNWILDDYDVFEFYNMLLANIKIDDEGDSPITRMIEHLKIIVSEKVEKEKEDWEADLQDMLEDNHYSHLYDDIDNK